MVVASNDAVLAGEAIADMADGGIAFGHSASEESSSSLYECSVSVDCFVEGCVFADSVTDQLCFELCQSFQTVLSVAPVAAAALVERLWPC